MGQDHYAVLGVSAEASREDIRSAYHAASLIYHPDRNSHRSEREQRWAEERFKEVSAAWQVLRDPQLRAAYDRQRRRQQAAETPPPGVTRTGPPAPATPAWPTADDVSWAQSVFRRYHKEQAAQATRMRARRNRYLLAMVLTGLLVPMAALGALYLGWAGPWPPVGDGLPAGWRGLLVGLLALEVLAALLMMQQGGLSLEMRATICGPCHVLFVFAIGFLPPLYVLVRLGVTVIFLLPGALLLYLISHAALGHLVVGRELRLWGEEEREALAYRFGPLLEEAQEILQAARK